MVLAGACDPFGSLEPSTAPVSRSATNQACAGPSGGATTAPASSVSGCAEAEHHRHEQSPHGPSLGGGWLGTVAVRARSHIGSVAKRQLSVGAQQKR